MPRIVHTHTHYGYRIFCYYYSTFETIVNDLPQFSNAQNVNRAGVSVHANWMHDCCERWNEINFLNSGFHFGCSESVHTYTPYSLDSLSERAKSTVLHSFPYSILKFSKCGIQDFNSVLRFIWYYIHHVIGLLTEVSVSCTNAFSISLPLLSLGHTFIPSFVACVGM